MGLEPTTPCLQSRCSSQLSYVPAGIRSYRRQDPAFAGGSVERPGPRTQRPCTPRRASSARNGAGSTNVPSPSRRGLVVEPAPRAGRPARRAAVTASTAPAAIAGSFDHAVDDRLARRPPPAPHLDAHGAPAVVGGLRPSSARAAPRARGSPTRTVACRTPGTASRMSATPDATTSHSRAPTGSGNHTSCGPTRRSDRHVAVVPLERPLRPAGRECGDALRPARRRRVRDVHLVGRLERLRRMAGRAPRLRPGNERAPGDHRAAAALRRRRRARGAPRPASAPRRRPPLPAARPRPRRGHLERRRPGIATATDVRRLRGGRGHGATTARAPRPPARPRALGVGGAVGDEHLVDALGVDELAPGPGADGAGAHNRTRRHRKSGPSSSRQPPVVTGTPLPARAHHQADQHGDHATSSPRRNEPSRRGSVPRVPA